MKKRLLLVVFGLTAILFLLAFSGCTDNLTKMEKYADAENYKTGNVTYEGPLKELNLVWKSGAVTLVEDASATAVTITEESKNDLPDKKKVHTFFDDGKLYVMFWKSGLKDTVDPDDKRLTVVYPSLTKINLAMGSGKLTANKITADEASVNIASGSCEIGVLSAKALAFRMASGKAVAETISSASMALDVASGSFTSSSLTADSFALLEASGSTKFDNFRASSVAVDIASGAFSINNATVTTFAGKIASGRITACFASVDTAEFDAVSGTIVIGLPESGAKVNFLKTSGSLVTEKPHTTNGNDYFFGEAKADIKVKVVSGTLRIE